MATSDDAPALLRHDPVSHYHWLDFGGFPGAEAHQTLKQAGWRWSRNREQYYTNRRFARPPEGISYEDGGDCDYSAERADRLEAGAAQHAAAAADACARSDALAALIPPGQPILVGHYSEGADRRRRARSHTLMGTAVDELRAAESLQQRAAASHRQQAQQADAGKLTRRRDRLAAELAKLERQEHLWTNHLDAWEVRTSQLRVEISALEQQIAAAGGLAADRAEIGVGDLIEIGGIPGIVQKVNAKTIQILARDNWPLTLSRTKFGRIIATRAELAANRDAARQQEGQGG